METKLNQVLIPIPKDYNFSFIVTLDIISFVNLQPNKNSILFKKKIKKEILCEYTLSFLSRHTMLLTFAPLPLALLGKDILRDKAVMFYSIMQM